MATISHTAAFKAQSDFAPESKIKVGNDIWAPETAGARLYEEVLSQFPATVQKAINLASELKSPFTEKQVMGHLKWLYTAGKLEVDGKSYVVKTKEPKPVKAKVTGAAKREAKGLPPIVQPARKRSLVRTKKLIRGRLYLHNDAMPPLSSLGGGG
jgi:hypothetical protein